MTRSHSFDPLLKYNFVVMIGKEPDESNVYGIDNILFRCGFTDVSSPEINIAYKEYHEGGGHMNPHHILVNSSFTDITLSRGVVKPSANYEKVVKEFTNSLTTKKTFADIVGSLFNTYNYNNAIDKTNYRYRIIIVQLRRDGTEAYRYILYNCVPTRFKPSSDFNSTGDDSVSTESITFKYEGYEFIDDPELIGNAIEQFL